MSSSNVARVYEYLRAVESMGPPESVAEFFAEDVTIEEFPNRIAPNGRVRRSEDLRKAYEQGRHLLRSQKYEVKKVVESGDEVAVELEWTGVLGVPVMTLAAGAEMKAYVAMFLTLREGKIVSQRNYDCYPPFEEKK